MNRVVFQRFIVCQLEGPFCIGVSDLRLSVVIGTFEERAIMVNGCGEAKFGLHLLGSLQ